VTGATLAGIRGQRLYLMAADSADIPRALGVITQRAWLAGEGFLVVSGSGSLLRRGPFDGSVGQSRMSSKAESDACDVISMSMFIIGGVPSPQRKSVTIHDLA
jgi:hypothetical protein